MARIINQVHTQATTSGFQQAGKEVEELGKKQTRLGNESTNTGRAFSSQASGLGGLVAAYAGAAATFFAVQQSFSALSAAARSQAMIEGVKSLAQSVGQDGTKIMSSLKSITREQLSMTEAAQNSAIALSAGLNGDQIEQLADIATRASKALGRDLTDSLQRLTRGVGKLEPELLDELGLFTRIEPAVERYAAKLGRAVSSLTNFERRQAFANAVLEEGSTKYSNVDTSLTDTSQNLNKLAASITDLATKVGQFIANALDPILRYLTSDISNLAGVFLLLGTLMFGKLGSVVREALDSMNKRVDSFAANTTRRFGSMSSSIQDYNKAMLDAQKAATSMNLSGLAGTKDQQEAARTAIRKIREGNVAPSELAGLQKVVSTQLETQRGLATPNSIKKTEELTIITSNLGDASKAVSPKVTLLGNAITFLGRAVTTTGSVLLKFVGFIGGLAFWYSVADIIGNIIGVIIGKENVLNTMLSSIGKYFSELFQGWSDARRANDALVSSFTAGDAEIKKNTSSLEVFNKAADEVRKSSQDIIKSGLGSVALTGSRASALQDITSFSNRLESGAYRGRPEDEAAARQRLAEAEAKLKEELDRNSADRRLAIQQGYDRRILAEENKLSVRQTAVERETSQATIALLRNRKTEYLTFYDDMVKALGEFGLQQENEINKLVVLLNQQLGTGYSEAIDMIKKRFVNLKDGMVSFTSLDKSFQSPKRSMEDLALGATKLEKAFEVTPQTVAQLSTAMMSNSVESSTLQGYLANLTKAQADLNTEMNNIAVRGEAVPDVYNKQYDSMQKIRVETEKTIKQLRILEQTEKDIKEVFGSGIQRAGKLISTGEIGQGGGVALTQEAQKTNQLKFLESVRTSEEDITKLEEKRTELLNEYNATSKSDVLKRKEIADQYASINKQLDVARNTDKARLSESIDFIKNMDQIAQIEAKKTKEAVHQLDMLDKQNKLAKLQREEEQKQLDYRLKTDDKRLRNEIAIANASIGQKRLENYKEFLDLSVEANERTKQRLQLEQELRNVQSEQRKIAIEGRAQPGILALERERALGQKFAGLTNPREQEALDLQLQIRQKEVELNKTYEDIKLASEQNLAAAIIDKSNAYLKLQAAKTEQDLVPKRAEAERLRINQEMDMRKAELEERKRQLTDTKGNAELVYKRDVAQIGYERDIQLIELQLTEERYKQLEIQANIFRSHTDELAKLFGREAGSRAADIRSIPENQRDKFIQDFQKSYVDDLGLAIARATITVPASIGIQRGAITAGAAERMSEAERVKKHAENMYKAEEDSINKRLTDTEKLRGAQLALSKLEEDAAKARADNSVEAAKLEEQAANLRYTIRNTELTNERDRLKQQKERQESELKLLREIAYLSGNNIFGALVDSIEIFRNKTSDFITTMLTDVVNGTKKARDVFRDFMLNLALDIQKTMMKKLVSDPIADAFGGVLAGVAKGVGASMFGGTPMTPGVEGITRTVPTTGLFGTGYAQNMGYASGPEGGRYAIGGPIKQMASGGGLRDRVPALLESGEFVVRRPAAQSIGEGNLNTLNAHGAVPLALALETIRQQGKRGDTELAHLNRKEMAVLKMLGGSGTRNPRTGLRQFDVAGGNAGSDSDTGSGGDGGGSDFSSGVSSLMDNFTNNLETNYGLGSITNESLGPPTGANVIDLSQTPARETIAPIDTVSQSVFSMIGDYITTSIEKSAVGQLVGGIRAGLDFSEIAQNVVGAMLSVDKAGIPAMAGIAASGFGVPGILGSIGMSTLMDVVSFLNSDEKKAGGGLVKRMASGGYAGMRDRIPALLEPGEFVMRRPAAMALGGSALNQMNATGQAPTGNVMVNVNNQGTPQTVEGAPKITRQGENLVIDIIVKDIQNNGPIRQTLKGMR